jgi:hypothetical protein
MIPLATFLCEGLLDVDRLRLYRMTVTDVELGELWKLYDACCAIEWHRVHVR